MTSNGNFYFYLGKQAALSSLEPGVCFRTTTTDDTVYIKINQQIVGGKVLAVAFGENLQREFHMDTHVTALQPRKEVL